MEHLLNYQPFLACAEHLQDLGFRVVPAVDNDVVLLQNGVHQVTIMQGSIIVRAKRFGLYDKHIITLTDALTYECIVAVLAASDVIDMKIVQSHVHNLKTQAA